MAVNDNIPWHLRSYFEEADAWIESRPKEQPLKGEGNPRTLILEIYSHWEKDDWKKCFETADKLIGLAPEISAGWIYRSRAVREMRSPREALKLLMPATTRFPDSWEILFYMACFHSAAKQYKKAGEWLEKAKGASHENVMQNELSTPDLAGYWKHRSRQGLAHPYEFDKGD